MFPEMTAAEGGCEGRPFSDGKDFAASAARAPTDVTSIQSTLFLINYLSNPLD